MSFRLSPVVFSLAAAACLCAGCATAGQLSVKKMKNKAAVLQTSFGTITFTFHPEEAPNHVRNFIKLAYEGFYDGLTFHRIVKGQTIQTGCPRGDGYGWPGYQLKAEFNHLKHLTGTVAMARGRDPDSAGSQFYICLTPRSSLDGRFTVFGQVIDGMDVVRRIGSVEVGARYKPLTPVILKRVRIMDRRER